MTFLSADEAAKLSLSEARNKAFEYSRQLKENFKLLSLSEALNKELEIRLKKLMNELGAKNQEVLFTAEQLNQFKDMLFGPSTERRSDADLPLMNQQSVELETKQRKKRTEFGRKPQAELPKVEVLHELSDEEMKAQGLKKWEGQFETSELINVNPARIVLEIHKRQKYLSDAAALCGKMGQVTAPESSTESVNIQSTKPIETSPIVTAPGPLKLKEGSRYSIEFGVETGLNKYCFHLPLDRQVQMLKQHGLSVESQTLFDQVDTIAWYLKPAVFEPIAAKIRSDRVNIADETPWGNLGKNAEGKKKFYLWGVRNDKAVCFEIFDSRSGKVAKSFLEGITGTLVTDGYKAYQKLNSDYLTIAHDWYHVRRKFVQAENSFPQESKFFIDQIRALSKIEDELKGKSLDWIMRIRSEQSKPIIEAIKERLEFYRSVLPKSSLGRAVQYTLNLWSGLIVFLQKPDVPLDTNAIERTLRGPVVGRKNHYGSKNLKSAEVAAIWYSVIETCKANQIDPKQYITQSLKDILEKKPVVLPWDWSQPSG